MAYKPRDVTDAELSVLQLLWELGPSTTRQLADLLYPDGGTSQYATVLKLLERLEKKDCVTRDRSGPVHVFDAALAREELIERRLQSVAESLCDGSRTPLLLHLVQPEHLNADERQKLRELLDEIEENPRRKFKKRSKSAKKQPED